MYVFVLSLFRFAWCISCPHVSLKVRAEQKRAGLLESLLKVLKAFFLSHKGSFRYWCFVKCEISRGQTDWMDGKYIHKTSRKVEETDPNSR